MASRKEIHSTEKLLNVIRNDNSKDTETPGSPARVQETIAGPVRRTVTTFKKITIGVDIGHTYIKLAKVARLSSKSYELIDYLTVQLDGALTTKNSEFQELLKTTLDQFCGDKGRYDIWSAIASAKVETRCLRIPKLPRNQVANAVFWTFTKTVEFNESDELLDFEILGDISEQGVKKTEVLTYKAPKKEAAELKAAFAAIGYPLKGISIAPFAIQNLMRTGLIEKFEQDACNVFIGRDWSRIAIFSNRNLVLSRGIKAGMQSMVDSIQQALIDSQDEVQTIGSDDFVPGQNVKGGSNLQSKDPKQLLTDLINAENRVSDKGESEREIELAHIFQMLRPAIERLIRQVERTFEHFASTFHREGVQQLLLSGPICASTVIVHYIGRQLDLPVSVLDPYGPGTGFAEKVKIPQSQEERESYAPAIGLALSHNSLTPNILYTHGDKDRDDSVKRLNMRILTACMICLVLLIVFFSWQERRLDAKRSQVEKLNQRLSAFQPQAEIELVRNMYAKVQDKRTLFERTVQRYRPLAVINELSQITPVNVRLLSTDIVFGGISAKAGNSATANHSDVVFIEGLVFGETDTFETTLTSYLLGLKNSPLFSKPNVQNRRIEFFNQQQVLHFSVRLNII